MAYLSLKRIASVTEHGWAAASARRTPNTRTSGRARRTALASSLPALVVVTAIAMRLHLLDRVGMARLAGAAEAAFPTLLAQGVQPLTAATVALVLFLAGLVSGLSGFAFSAVAASILWLLPPLQAVPLIMLLSLCNQLLSIGTLCRQMRLRATPECEGALPYILGGLAGLPFGIAALRCLPAALFAGALGGFLVLYSLFSLARPAGLRIGLSGWKPAAAVGAAGGLVGGFSAFPGSLPVVYLGLRGVGKAESRGVTQPYILAMQLASLGLLAASNAAIFDRQFWLLWALTLPAVLLGSASGIALYSRMSEVNFRRAVLLLLAISGLSLCLKTII